MLASLSPAVGRRSYQAMVPKRWTFTALVLFATLLLAGVGREQDTALADPPAISLEEVALGLVKPVAITHAGDGSGRLFITLQAGEVVIYDGTQVLPTPFLDLKPLVGDAGFEQGFLSVAFHPDYATNGFFYVNYTDNV